MFFLMFIAAFLRWRTLSFYKDGQNNIYDEGGHLKYDPIEDVMSTVDDPNIVLETSTHHSSCMENKLWKERLKLKIQLLQS